MKHVVSKRTHQTPFAAGGFSLVELLVVIAIMGILAGLGIGYLTNLNDSIGETRDRRNAQEIATTAAAAGAAGLSLVVPGDTVETARNVAAGATATKGAFSGKVFRVPGMNDADIVNAAYYLDLNGDTVVYNGNRRHP